MRQPAQNLSVHKKFTIKFWKSPIKDLLFMGDYAIIIKVQRKLTKDMR